jgi:hypothetical protein
MTAANATRLRVRGYVVLEDTPFQDQGAQYRHAFDRALQEAPEFQPGTTKFVMGGFGALGHPSSFHNSFVRHARRAVHDLVRPTFQSLAPGRNLEQLVDRMLFRPAGETPARERWHRDEAKGTLPNDLTFGGWINFDAESQFFSCVPGTHVAPRGQGGFARLSKDDMAALTARREKVEVPPGGVLLFFEHLVHEVEASKKPYDMRRLFVGFRITDSILPFLPDLHLRLADFAVLPLKSGQTPPMFAALHWTNHTHKLQEWAQSALKPELLETKTMRSGAKQGKVYRIPPRFLPSLRELGFAHGMIPYQPREIEILTPQPL